MAEANQVKWVGIRPVSPVENIQTHPGPFEATVAGVTRAQIIKYKSATATEAIIHTVTAGKTFYMTSCSISLRHTAADDAFIRIRNASDVEVTRILHISANANSAGNSAKSFPMPISIAAGYDITTKADNGAATGSIEGWEE